MAETIATRCDRGVRCLDKIHSNVLPQQYLSGIQTLVLRLIALDASTYTDLSNIARGQGFLLDGI
jgi:hypothetical protein